VVIKFHAQSHSLDHLDATDFDPLSQQVTFGNAL
jgi:hypothetical protein